MAAKMPPPGSGHGVAIIIGVPKPVQDGPGGRMAPPGSDQMGKSGKASAEEAGVVLDSEHCIDCKNYHPDTGECDKVDGIYSPQDGCHEYFTAIDHGGEPDADDAGGVPDGDADDQGQAGGQS